VGRQAEIDRIIAAVDSASGRQGSVLLIAGEAGVGKTRLIDEAVRLTRTRGNVAVVGHCVELGPSRLCVRGDQGAGLATARTKGDLD
jgi:predicted ATPase